jgi:hypothetical protein
LANVFTDLDAGDRGSKNNRSSGVSEQSYKVMVLPIRLSEAIYCNVYERFRAFISVYGNPTWFVNDLLGQPQWEAKGFEKQFYTHFTNRVGML